MELRDYVAALRRGWLIIVACTVAAAGLASGITSMMAPVYQTSTQVFLSMNPSEGTGLGFAASSAAYVRQRVSSYSVVADSPGVLQPVIDQLGLETTPRALAARVSAVGIPETVVIAVTAMDTDPAAARVLADAVADSLSQEIVRLETPAGAVASPINASIITPAAEPRIPIAPRPRVNVMLGTLVGFLIGIGLAIMRFVLDTTVKTPVELGAASRSNVLGVIGFDARAKKKPLIALEQGSSRAEAFRSIRTNLQYVDVDDPPRVVVVTSPLPDEGKTTSACNLAITFAQAGTRVLLIEGDLRRPRVAEYLGVEGSVGLTDVLVGRRLFHEAAITWRHLLDVLPSGPIPPNPSELLGSQQMASLLREKTRHYDVVLIDAPPLLPVTDAAVLTSLSDGAILIARHGKTRREHVVAATDALHQVGGRLLGVVMNFMPAPSRRRGYGYGYGYGHGYNYEYREYGDKEPRRGRLKPEESEVVLTPGQGPRGSAAAEPLAVRAVESQAGRPDKK